jgi:hypothetical protein
MGSQIRLFAKPKPDSHAVCVRLRRDQLEFLDSVAGALGLTRSGAATAMVKDYLRKCRSSGLPRPGSLSGRNRKTFKSH